jgi:acylpyruvate hydrolase
MQAIYQTNAVKAMPKIVGVGKNYLKHVKEMGGSDIPKAPVLFFKPWSSISYNPSKLSLPISKFNQVDHELELGIVISKTGSHISKEEAFNHIGGYFIGIDFSDRGMK